MKSFLRWWLLFCITTMVLGIAGYLGYFTILWEADISKLSFFILSLFYGFTIFIGALTYRNWKQIPIHDRELKSAWFVADSMTTIGLTGTVVGFIYMLGTAFVDLKVDDIASVEAAVQAMTVGMSTALFTTLAGIVTGWLLKLQLVHLENAHS